jgi:membrane-associated phospholipid phosphatase
MLMPTENPAPLLQPADNPAEAGQEAQQHHQALFRGAAILGLGGTLLILFGLVTALVAILDPLSLDVPITRAVQGLNAYPPLSDALDAVSWPGFAPWSYILPAALVLIVAALKRVTEAAFLLLATISTALADVVKMFVHRLRPSETLVNVIHNQHLDGSSFPSSHVVEYTLVCGFLFYLAFTLMKPGILRTALLIGSGALIALVGPSRILMGQHWASDVLGGYALGFAVLLVIIWAYRGWEVRFARRAQAVAQTASPGSGH